MSKPPATEPGKHVDRADVTIREDGIISVAYTGGVTQPMVELLLKDLATATAKQRAQGLPVYILINISGVTTHSSLARSTIKEAIHLDFDRGAAFGGTLAQGLVMQYLQRAISAGKARYYRREVDALLWLREGRDTSWQSHVAGSMSAVALPFILMLGIAAASLYGFQNSLSGIKAESTSQFSQHVDTVTAGLQKRMQVYVSALYGFRGLFAASKSVERDEFRTYYQAINLNQNYPGLDAITFARQVKLADKTTYIKTVRQDTSVKPTGYPDFTITPSVTKPTYTVLEYVEPDGPTSASLGFDLSSSPERNEAFIKARDTDQVVATKTLTLVGSTPAKGFLVTLPIYSKPEPTTLAGRQAKIYGYVNTVFDYDLLFEDVLAKDLGPAFGVEVTDAAGTKVFDHNPVNPGTVQTQTRTLSIGGQNFSILFEGPINFGLSAITSQVPLAIGVGGLASVILLLVVIWQILRSRRQAVVLADNMTEDLAHERNHAVEMQQQLSKAEADLRREKASVERQVVERTRELAEAQGQLLAAIRGLPFGFAVVDATDRVALANHAFLHLAARRITDETDATRSILKTLAKDFGATINLVDLIHETQSSRKAITRHIEHGEKFYRCSFLPITASGETSGGERIIGAVVIIEDVTEQKALDRSRDEFFSIASHELRTPLTAIMGNTDMALDFYKAHLAKIPELLQMITDTHDASGHLITIVNDFLDMSSLEQGHTKFKLEPIDLRPMAEQILRDFQSSADEQKLSLKLDAPAGSVMALADATKTHQILVNLMSNALQYTEHGGITLKLAPEGKVVRVLVADTGKGIPEEFRHLLFRKFQQASSDILTRDNTRSTGLGLYISKLMAKGMSSQLELESTEVGKGTVFALELATAPDKKSS